MDTKQDPREPILPVALKIMLHARSYLSVIIFLICVCWHRHEMRLKRHDTSIYSCSIGSAIFEKGLVR